MTLQELILSVRNHFMGRTDKDAVIQEGLNFALEEAFKIHPWLELRRSENYNVLTNAYFIPLPTDTYDVLEVRNVVTSSWVYKLSIQKQEWFLKYFAAVETYPAGRPIYAYWNRRDARVYLGPKCYQNYTFYITRLISPGRLVNPTDVPAISHIDQAIIAYATSYAFESIAMPEQANRWLERWQFNLRNAMLADNRQIGGEEAREEFTIQTQHINPATPWLDPFVRE